MLRWHVVSAVFERNVKQYFSSVLGYLFIVVFVTACAILTFNQQFFADNLANLDQLTRWFPGLLLFFVPAITMTAWADEKKQGTDAILFTLPASDFEITLGKYLSVAAVYSISLLFSSTQLIALKLIGDPDWGIILTTYFGYWLVGLALLAIGLFASSLTDSPTISFVIGTLLCSIPVSIGLYFRGTLWLERLGIEWNLHDFSEGLIPLANVVYFATLIVLMIYLNLVVISRRHWGTGRTSILTAHFAARVVLLMIGLISVNYVATQWSSGDWTRADLTGESLFTLDETTRETIRQAKEKKRPITIQAFVSNDVPRSFVNAKKQFIGLLRQYDYYGGNYVNVRYVDVAPHSPEEEEAKKSGIQPIDDRSEVAGRTIEQSIFLGARVSSSLDDVVISAVDNHTAIEYELTRSIFAATDKNDRPTLGILDTDTHFGCRSMDGKRFPSYWAYAKTLQKLENLFNVKPISQAEFAAYAPPPESNSENATPQPPPAPDVLIVADPSSLTEQANDTLIRYIDSGKPAIILVDPLPIYLTYLIPQFGIINAPCMPRIDSRNQYFPILGSAKEPKVDSGATTQLMSRLGIKWRSSQVAWNLANPHPNFSMKWKPELGDRWPKEYFGPYDQFVNFVRQEGNEAVFNDESPITSGLREILFFYPGSLEADETAKDIEFRDLISLGTQSGLTDWDEIAVTPKRQTQHRDRTGEIIIRETAARSPITQRDLVMPRARAQSLVDENSHVVAAHVLGKGKNQTNVICIADTDFLSNLYYDQEAQLDQPLDNFVFLLNSIEVLIGDQKFVSLRNRRPVLRTLVRFEEQVNQFRKRRAEKTAEAEKRIQKQREDAEAELKEAGNEIKNDSTLDVLQQSQMFSQRKSDAMQRLRQIKRKLNEELDEEIQSLKSSERQKTTALENRIRFLSVFLAPVPAMALGLFILTLRSRNERRTMDPRRRVDAHRSSPTTEPQEMTRPMQNEE